MAKLYKHGHAVVEYRRTRKLDSGSEIETIYRLMSDGKVLKNTKFLTESREFGRGPRSSGWKLAKLKAEIADNLELLVPLGFTKVTL